MCRLQSLYPGVCPVEEANIAYIEDGLTKVLTDSDKRTACGACLTACNHDSRDFVDDTKRFFEDPGKGEAISVSCAPAGRVSLDGWNQAPIRPRGSLIACVVLPTRKWWRVTTPSYVASNCHSPCGAFAGSVWFQYQ